MARRKPRRKRHVVVRTSQLKLPAGYHRDSGKPATLKDVVAPDVPTVDGDQLTREQRAELTLLRIQKQKRFTLATIRHGLIDKQRALDEVRNQTPLGRALVEIEQIAIQLVREEAERRRKRRRRRKK